MSIEMKVPVVGESISEVTIAAWMKGEGDFVELDEILCEMESDKATFELRAESAGVLHIVAAEGDTLEIGATICRIEAGESQAVTAPTAKTETAAPAASGEAKIVEMFVTPVGESITEVTIGSINKEEGSTVELDEILCEIESDKATFELPAEASGIVRWVAAEGDVLEIGGLICRIEVPAGGVSAPSKPLAAPAESPAVGGDTSYAAGHPSPAAAKILAEKGISPTAVKGSGPGGRITKEDAEAAKKTAAPAPQKSAAKPAEESSAPAGNTAFSRNERRERMTSLRKTVARRLVSVKNETAMLTTFNEVDMKPIMDLRKQYKDMFKEKHQVGLGFMSFFIKAACIALQEFPGVNAQLNDNEVVYSDFCDISIAVSAPKGLVVPVIRNAESLDFAGIEKEVVRLALKARDNKLSIPEMTGGTFTITNGGIFGSMLSTPIINAPQSAILGMHNIVERPMAVNGEVKIRPIMYLALSYDHRIIDGRESVSFLVRMKQLLEDPARMMLMV